MRLWSIHPKYLDQKGLCGLWLESLIAQNCLLRKNKGYNNHPQLTRFKQCKKPIEAIGHYLMSIYEEGISRGYNFDLSKIIHRGGLRHEGLTVTKGQIEYEFNHLQSKLKERDIKRALKQQLIHNSEIISHPIFEVVNGNIESWEKV